MALKVVATVGGATPLSATIDTPVARDLPHSWAVTSELVSIRVTQRRGEQRH
jgi:hypothetical protein